MDEFSTDNFDSVNFINSLIESCPGEEFLDSHITSASMNLQFLAFEVNHQIHQSMKESASTVTNAHNMLDRVKSDAEKLEQSLQGITESIHSKSSSVAVEEGSLPKKSSIEQLCKIHAIKGNMKLCIEIAKAFQAWKSLFTVVESKVRMLPTSNSLEIESLASSMIDLFSSRDKNGGSTSLLAHFPNVRPYEFVTQHQMSEWYQQAYNLKKTLVTHLTNLLSSLGWQDPLYCQYIVLLFRLLNQSAVISREEINACNKNVVECFVNSCSSRMEDGWSNCMRSASTNQSLVVDIVNVPSMQLLDECISNLAEAYTTVIDFLSSDAVHETSIVVARISQASHDRFGAVETIASEICLRSSVKMFSGAIYQESSKRLAEKILSMFLALECPVSVWEEAIMNQLLTRVTQHFDLSCSVDQAVLLQCGLVSPFAQASFNLSTRVLRQRYLHRIHLSLRLVTESSVKSKRRVERKNPIESKGSGMQFESVLREEDLDEANKLLFSSINYEGGETVTFGHSSLHICAMEQYHDFIDFVWRVVFPVLNTCLIDGPHHFELESEILLAGSNMTQERAAINGLWCAVIDCLGDYIAGIETMNKTRESFCSLINKFDFKASITETLSSINRPSTLLNVIPSIEESVMLFTIGEMTTSISCNETLNSNQLPIIPISSLKLKYCDEVSRLGKKGQASANDSASKDVCNDIKRRCMSRLLNNIISSCISSQSRQNHIQNCLTDDLFDGIHRPSAQGKHAGDTIDHGQPHYRLLQFGESAIFNLAKLEGIFQKFQFDVEETEQRVEPRSELYAELCEVSWSKLVRKVMGNEFDGVDELSRQLSLAVASVDAYNLMMDNISIVEDTAAIVNQSPQLIDSSTIAKWSSAVMSVVCANFILAMVSEDTSDSTQITLNINYMRDIIRAVDAVLHPMLIVVDSAIRTASVTTDFDVTMHSLSTSSSSFIVKFICQLAIKIRSQL